MDAEAQAAGRHDAVEHASAGSAAQRQPHDAGARLDEARAQAPSARSLHGDERSRLREEGRRHRRSASESAGSCRGVLCRRENGNPGARSQGSGLAALAGARRAARLRVLPARHVVALCGVQHADRDGAGEDRHATHLGGVRRVLDRYRREPATWQRFM